jgi:hydroxymethylpyrimidine pyrophosphatase-like HAD family hydrolase
MWFFKAVALDLDGTLTENDRLADTGISAVRASRADLKMILVTGRIFGDLEGAYPGLWSEFDAVVAENGAVLHARSDMRLLASPVDPAVHRALAGRGITARAGRALLAIDGDDAAAAIEVVAELGLDHQVVHNRGAAMIVPAGVTKGTGLLAALDELGLSPHNTIAAGMPKMTSRCCTPPRSGPLSPTRCRPWRRKLTCGSGPATAPASRNSWPARC